MKSVTRSYTRRMSSVWMVGRRYVEGRVLQKEMIAQDNDNYVKLYMYEKRE